MNIYGLEIPNESGFWDEIKLRAMNNYGNDKNITENVDHAIEDVCNDLFNALVDSKEVELLRNEIETDIALEK